MEHLPVHVSIVFILTTLLCLFIFYYATNKSGPTLVILISWLAIQALVTLKGFYTVTDTIPPRFILLLLPPLLLIAGIFISARGRKYIDSLNIKTLTILHVVRIPVEVVLAWLFINNTIPKLMTFEGRNFDILSGLTAPVIYYWGFIKKTISKKIILVWNFICLGLLMNIVFYAILSAPFPFQHFGFEQPNIALLYFPFTWLPCCVVPLVLFSHLVTIRRLILNRD